MGPDKLRFDFTHGERLSDEERADVDALLGDWIAGRHAVHALETTRAEAEALGALALFGEKYGDWVRMVEIEGVSRELCGGTHVAATAELGLFHLTSETSSASNVRRIEAVTGPAGAELFRERTRRLEEIAGLLRVPEHEVVRAVERLGAEGQGAREASPRGGPDRDLAERLVAGADELAGLSGGRRGGARRRTPRPCWRSPTRYGRSSATRRWCWVRRSATGRSWWPTWPPRRWSAA